MVPRTSLYWKLIGLPTVVTAAIIALLTILASMIERSTGHAEQVWTAIAIGAVALLIGLLAAARIARSLARRLHAISSVATAIATDDRQQLIVEDAGTDEIGALAGAFNGMVAQLRGERARMRDAVIEIRRARHALNNNNRDLEERVATRTRALMRVEVELRQAQKLESVGRLAAGLAHEINTPVQFASDSCAFVQDGTHDLLALIDDYRAILATHGARDEAAIVEAARDLPYLAAEIPSAVDRARTGLDRVASIVSAMKDFAHPDRTEQAPADLNRAISSTLIVARNEYKYVADLTTVLGDLPPVPCNIGDLNQVVLNLVINAAHAIEARGEARGAIELRTWVAPPNAMISVRDDGCGIDAAVLDKIFDPFFTTKEVGKGRGQGLAVAHAVIVDKHHGTLTVDSEVGRGSTFTIALPLAA